MWGGREDNSTRVRGGREDNSTRVRGGREDNSTRGEVREGRQQY